MNHATRLNRFHETDLYVVITEAFCAGRSSEEILDAALTAGVRLIQFREKDMPDGERHRRAEAFRKKTADAEALLIVNDRVDIALAVNADGVHLGQGDLPPKIARDIVPELLIGVSTHNRAQAEAAQEAGASYVNIGPIFPTQTKAVTAEALGPAAIAEIAPHLSIPFTCMGGIKADNIEQVLRHGARHPAVVTAVTAQPDPEQAARELRDRIGQARRT